MAKIESIKRYNGSTWETIDLAPKLENVQGLQAELDGKSDTGHKHAAGDITSGTLATDRIPNLPASKITSGTVASARLPSNIVYRSTISGDWSPTTGAMLYFKGTDLSTLAPGSNGNILSMGTNGPQWVAPSFDVDVKTLKTTSSTSQTPSTGESLAGTGTIELHRVSKSGSYGDLLNKPTIPSTPGEVGAAPATHNHSASNITSGTLPVGRGGTGRTSLATGQVLVGNGSSLVTLQSRSGIDTRTAFPTNIANISATGTASSSTFLRGDGAWATPPSGGGSTDWTLIVDVQLNDLVPGGGEASASYTAGTYTEFWVMAWSVGASLNPDKAAHYIMPEMGLGSYVGRTLPGYQMSDMNIYPNTFSASWDKSGFSSSPSYRLMVYAR